MNKMKGKLIKGKNSGEYMINLEGVGYVTTYESTLPHKLSLKNCQAIERGYDLMKLAEENSHKYYDVKTTDWHCNYNGFFSGFQKALEILGDKKFSHGQMLNAMDLVWEWMNGEEYGCETLTEVQNKHIQSLKQTEWDVIVEMECVIGCQNLILNGENSVCCGDKKPKISEDGCLILKRT